MNNAVKIIIAIVVVAVVAVVAWLLLGNKTVTTTQSSTASSTTTPSPSSTTTPPAATPAATITYNGSGFSPATTTVKAGDTVQVTNSSSTEVDFDSDPHPIHTDEPELNIGAVAPGKSKTFVVTKKGTWGYHNHLDPTQQGKLQVE